MGALLALIPGKDWFYGALVVGLGVFVWHFYEKYKDAVDFMQQAKAETVRVQQEANERIKTLTDRYDKATEANKVIYENELAAADKQHASDVERLRALSAARQTDPVLSGAAGLAAAVTAWSGLVGRLEGLSAGAAEVIAADDAAARECWRDRDAVSAAAGASK